MGQGASTRGQEELVTARLITIEQDIHKSIEDISRTARTWENHTVHNAIILIIIPCAKKKNFCKGHWRSYTLGEYND